MTDNGRVRVWEWARLRAVRRINAVVFTKYERPHRNTEHYGSFVGHTYLHPLPAGYYG